MTVQPCGCGSTEFDWPYDPAVFDPDDTNGYKCGDDGDGNTIMWSYPTADVGSFVAIKNEAAGIPDGGWVDLGSMAVETIGSYFNGTNVFTAPREGMWDVTFKTVVDFCNPEDMDLYLRIRSNYGSWATTTHGCASDGTVGDDGPFLFTHDHPVAFLGGGTTLSGVLPCVEGGTLTYELLHTASPTKTFHDTYMSAFWKCPLPTPP